jgi:hypothetical protein
MDSCQVVLIKKKTRGDSRVFLSLKVRYFAA